VKGKALPRKTGNDQVNHPGHKKQQGIYSGGISPEQFFENIIRKAGELKPAILIPRKMSLEEYRQKNKKEEQ
jgi:hypothetical protein